MSKKKSKHATKVKKVKVLAIKPAAEPDVHVVDLQMEVSGIAAIPPVPLPAEIKIGDKPLADAQRSVVDWLFGWLK